MALIKRAKELLFCRFTELSSLAYKMKFHLNKYHNRIVSIQIGEIENAIIVYADTEEITFKKLVITDPEDHETITELSKFGIFEIHLNIESLEYCLEHLSDAYFKTIGYYFALMDLDLDEDDVDERLRNMNQDLDNVASKYDNKRLTLKCELLVIDAFIDRALPYFEALLVHTTGMPTITDLPTPYFIFTEPPDAKYNCVSENTYINPAISYYVIGDIADYGLLYSHGRAEYSFKDSDNNEICYEQLVEKVKSISASKRIKSADRCAGQPR